MKMFEYIHVTPTWILLPHITYTHLIIMLFLIVIIYEFKNLKIQGQTYLSAIGSTIPRKVIIILIHMKAQQNKYNAFYACNKNASILYLKKLSP
jgi:hypothetical protein